MGLSSAGTPQKFIAAEMVGGAGEAGERRVWDGICAAFADRDCLAYWRYPIFSTVGDFRKEPDVLIADTQLGLVAIEVKSVAIDQIRGISGHWWQFCNFYTARGNPYQQAETHLFALLDYCDRETTLKGNIQARALVALPKITRSQWRDRGFDRLPSSPPILFADDLDDPRTVFQQIAAIPSLTPGKPLSGDRWKQLRAVIGGTSLFRPPSRRFFVNPETPTRGAIVAQMREHLAQFDLEQEHLAKRIPPGPQRIRGVAGSGKTVLLCQKAAHMHLKHPEWTIALMFFSRTLRDPIIDHLDRWLRRFSRDRVRYDPDSPNLRVFHAWGSRGQPGLYRLLCETAGVRSLSSDEAGGGRGGDNLARACAHLLRTAPVPQIFDALLIDEAQDLVADESFKFGEKQPFFWMAYQSLRPVSGRDRRLIWAYDELQALQSLAVPTADELFGDELGQMVAGFYADGLPKTIVLRRGYRTPAPVLTVAHAIALGLLHRSGALTQIRRPTDWQSLGYDVKADVTSSQIPFRPGQRVTIAPHPQADFDPPHPLPQLWERSAIEFETYASRSEELTALTDRLLYNLKVDGLRPSRELLVIILGTGSAARQLEAQVANFLIEQGLDIFIPGQSECNCLRRERRTPGSDRFWCEGGITLSRIHPAKGQEADLVYLVGLDHLAGRAESLTVRHQLFVALTRTRGWVRLSGIGNFPFYGELWRTIRHRDSLTFRVGSFPQRQMDLNAEDELRRRYRRGHRNFRGIDLAGAQLAGHCLRDANLVAANLQGADLTAADLDRTRLAAANLSRAALDRAKLRKASLAGAILSEATLAGADLSQADLRDADLRRADLTDAVLRGSQIMGADLSHANLKGANLLDADLSETGLIGTDLKTAVRPDGEIHP